MARFAHYTAAVDTHLFTIISTRVILPVESNLSFHVERRGPDVVWLLPVDTPTGSGPEHGLNDAKRSGRIVVDVPDAVRWVTWAPQQPGFDRDTFDTLVRVGGGMKKARTWWLVTRPVPVTEWVSVDILGPDGTYQPFLDPAAVADLAVGYQTDETLQTPTQARARGRSGA